MTVPVHARGFDSPLRQQIADLLVGGATPAAIRAELARRGFADTPSLCSQISQVRQALGLPPFIKGARPSDTRNYFNARAAAHGCTCDQLQARVLAVVARDDLLKAILDEGGDDGE